MYLEDFSTLKTQFIISGGFEIVFGNSLHGFCSKLGEPLGCLTGT